MTVTGVLVLALALPAALLVVWPWVGHRTGSTGTGEDGERAALETEKRLALRAIRELDLDREAGHLLPGDYEVLRGQAEVEAAAVLRRLDALGPPPEPPRSPAEPWTRRPAVLAGSGLGLVAFGLALGLLVARFTSPTPAQPQAMETPGAAATPGPVAAAPGPPASGDAGPPAGAPPRPIPPGVLQGMLQAAHQSLDAGRYQEAIAAYKAVLRREPANVEAITHLGVILAVAGHADGALEAFDRALAIDPGYAHAWWDKGRVLAEQKKDDRGAIEAWKQFLEVGPPGPDRTQAETWIREARGRLASAPPATPRPGTTPPPSARPGQAKPGTGR